MSDTPRTDALTFEIEARRKLRGFNMPEDLADALNLSDKIESELTTLRAALAERQAAIDAIVRCDMSHAVMQTSTTLIRLESAIDNARALATKDKEPQPAAKE